MPVYLIRAGESGPVKIGLADDPPGRLAELQVAHYEKLTLVRMWEGGRAEEAALHMRFAPLRIRGEWFAPAAEMLGDVALNEIPLPEAEIFVAGMHGLDALRSQRGAIVKTAKVLGINQSAVSQWRKIPAEYVAQIEAATEIPRQVLRPDLWPPEHTEAA